MDDLEEKRIGLLSALSIDNVFKKLALGELELGAFSEYFEKPEYYYAQGWPEKPANWPQYEGKNLIPLWEYSKCVYLVDITEPNNQYFSFRIDSPEEPTRYSSLYHMVFEIIDFHCFQIGAEFSDALEFMKKLKYPNLELFERLRAYESPEFDEIYDRYIEVLKCA